MRKLLHGSMLALVLVGIALAQQAQPDRDEVAAHRLAPARPVHLAGARGWDNVSVTVDVDAEGRVTAVRLQDPKIAPATARAVDAAVRAWRFQPFLRDGKPVPVTFEAQVDLLPPEQHPTVHVPFPEIRDWKQVVIRLRRTGCFGSCPSYSVELHGDGTVVFTGHSFTLLEGAHRGHISPDAFQALVARFKAADFFSLRDKYEASVTDNPTYELSLAIGAQSKHLTDYVGSWVGMPASVTELEDAIDQAAGTDKWIKGTAETVPALLEEDWDFRSREAGATLARAAESAPPEVVTALLNAGVPVDVSGYRNGFTGGADQDSTPLVASAARGNAKLVSLLLAAGAANKDPRQKDRALLHAAMSGDLPTVKLLLDAGADPQFHDENRSVLMAAAAAGNMDVLRAILNHQPDVNYRGYEGKTALMVAAHTIRNDDDKRGVDRADEIRQLLAAGADVNAADDSGETALHQAWNADIAHALVQGGANLEARDQDGETPLNRTYDADVARVLLLAGADVNAKDNDGHTPLDNAQPDKAKVIQEFLAGKLK